MASFDISSLFLLLSVLICVLICCLRDTLLFGDCRFNRDQLRNLLTFAVKDNQSVFNGRLYDQIDGIAMGPPLGPSMPNICMCSLEQKYLTGFPSECKPVVYRRYVDDTFCLFKHRDHIDKFLEYINNFHSNIKFTVDIEEETKPPIFDVLVTCDETGFSTSLYRTKTFTGLLL